MLKVALHILVVLSLIVVAQLLVHIPVEYNNPIQPLGELHLLQQQHPGLVKQWIAKLRNVGAEQCFKTASDLVLNTQSTGETAPRNVALNQLTARGYLNGPLKHILRPTITPTASTASVGRIQARLEGRLRSRIVKHRQIQHLTVGLVGLVHHKPRHRISHRGDIEGVQSHARPQVNHTNRDNARRRQQEADGRDGHGDVIHLPIAHPDASPYTRSSQRLNGLGIEAQIAIPR